MGTLAAIVLLLATTDADAAREAAACRAAEAPAVAVEDARGLALTLVDVLKDGTTTARACAATALAKIGPVVVGDATLARRLEEEAVPVLVLGLDQRGDMCRAAADALGALGAIASDAVPHLEEKLANESCSRQGLHAQSALQRIRSDG